MLFVCSALKLDMGKVTRRLLAAHLMAAPIPAVRGGGVKSSWKAYSELISSLLWKEVNGAREACVLIPEYPVWLGTVTHSSLYTGHSWGAFCRGSVLEQIIFPDFFSVNERKGEKITIKKYHLFSPKSATLELAFFSERKANWKQVSFKI